VAVDITATQRRQVVRLAGLGLRDADIALVVGLAEATMQRRCRDELDKGRAQANAKLAARAMQLALSGRNTAMVIFMCKVRLGWREVAREPKDEGGEAHELAIE
jgi:hypothetical protein